MRKFLMLLAIGSSLLYGGVTLTPEVKSLLNQAKVGLEATEAETLSKMIEEKKVILIDVRDPDEWETGAIKAEKLVKISRGFLEVKYDKLILKDYKKSDKFVVYCGIEPRAIFATKRLKELGFTDVSYLKGGFSNWKSKGYKVSK